MNPSGYTLLSPAYAPRMPGAGVHMHVNIHQAGRDVEARDVHDLGGLCGIDIARDRGDAAVLDGDVHDCVNVVPGIDDVAALEQQIVWRLRQCRRRQKKKD